MAEKRDRVYVPAGIGGLIRYGEEEEKGIKLKPKHVVYFVVAIILLELILKFAFPLV
ncbi:MAG: preprotein translocase subunit Sec61beta [Candidatus Aenigmatarchaeota archaeon]